MATLALLIFSFICGATYAGSPLNCNYVGSLSCGGFGLELQCGTDGFTYDNRCFFAKALCKESTLHIYSAGRCPVSTTPGTTGASTLPTTSRQPLFQGHDNVLDFFCRELSHEKCQNDTERVCGNDGSTYQSYCEFEKQRCTHRHLAITRFGTC